MLNKSVLSVLALFALFSLTAAPALAADENVHGSWKFVEMNGEAAPVNMTWTFAQDGTLTMTMSIPDQPPMTMNGSYTADQGKLTVKMSDEFGGEENTADYVIEGKNMTITGEEEGEQIVVKLERVQ